jgi:hypothetical protein
VPLASPERSEAAKQFAPPRPGFAGVYVYRDGTAGRLLKKAIRVNGHCLGESAPGVFFHREVAGGVEHVISTESEFWPNELRFTAKAGANHYFRQSMRLGVFFGGATLERVSEEEGRRAIAGLELARKGGCRADS